MMRQARLQRHLPMEPYWLGTLGESDGLTVELCLGLTANGVMSATMVTFQNNGGSAV